VEKLSLPYRIALVALLAVGVLWFVMLRPKAGSEPAPAAAPGVTGLASDIAKAKGAVDAATAAPPASTTPVKPAAAKPAAPPKPGLADDAAPGDPSKAILAQVDKGKVAVVLFWNHKASDDRATRNALRAVDRHRGKVVTAAIPVRDVGRYDAITRGAQILESPTVLVIGAGGKARAIAGYTQTREIDQAVSDIGGHALVRRPRPGA
jgi:hypothetical protein